MQPRLARGKGELDLYEEASKGLLEEIKEKHLAGSARGDRL